jgi:hypothetical protein
MSDGEVMIRYRHFILTASTVLLAAGCREPQSDPVPASLPGSYVYAARGSTLKKPWEFAARLELTPDRRYRFTLDKTVDGEKDPTESSVGSYDVSGNHLMIHDSDDAGTASKDLHKLLIKADSLIAEVGWTAEIFLKGVGAPNIVFVKERRG